MVTLLKSVNSESGGTCSQTAPAPLYAPYCPRPSTVLQVERQHLGKVLFKDLPGENCALRIVVGPGGFTWPTAVSTLVFPTPELPTGGMIWSWNYFLWITHQAKLA